ncbi:CotH kinase family protein, partial [Akkermansiaceae bacterium]|nr:CotH kinase family protein [Akkermansiaceae bacterium]
KVSLSIEGELKKKNLGIYVLIEQVDENYLERKFGEKSKSSLLMKPETHANWQHPGEEIEQYKEVFNIKEGEDNKEQITQFGDFLSLIGEVSGTDFSNQIGEKMDLDFYAGYLAATSLLASLDSYIGAPHNYYLMVDRADNKVRLFPWDVNEAFGTFTMGTTPEKLAEWDITRPWTSNIPLLERLFTHKDFSKLYREKLNELMKDSFTEKNLYERVDIFTNALKPYLSKEEQIAFHMGIEGDSSGKNSAVERDIFAIKPFIKRRIRSVKAQLAGKSKGVKIEGRGGRPLRRQAPREESRPPKD